MGYPESYYTPPSEALDRIEIIRGAASLQYGTQFGGLVNFVLKNLQKKKLNFKTRNTLEVLIYLQILQTSAVRSEN